jgi:23S rRNA (cytidine2498-2'-O)-methyltransferase
MTPPSVQDCLAKPPQFLGEDFAFVVCQQATESCIKQHWVEPDRPFRLAFSRPGLITFKVLPHLESIANGVDAKGSRATECPEGSPGQTVSIDLPSHPLIRLSGWVLGQVRGTLADEMADQVLDLGGDDWQALHVFSRDSAMPGEDGFEPGQCPLAEAIGLQLRNKWLARNWRSDIAVNQPCAAGSRVLDVVLVEPNHWIVGYHWVESENIASSWPGGAYSLELPDAAISRAYLKMAEAVAWSQLPIRSGDAVVEIGSAPGGAAQRLLDMGLVVTGVDPAEMDPSLLEHPRFTHWRSKSMAVKRKKYSQFRWLTADANVAPNYTLDSVQDIVTYPTSRFEGLLLTLKLSDYRLLDHLEEYLARIRSWNFRRVQARQLSHNRRELCVVAQK